MLFDQITETDLGIILNSDGVEIAFSPVGGTSRTVKGVYNTHSLTIDASTGQEILASIPSVSVRRSELEEIVTGGDWPNLPQKGWVVSVSWRGDTVSGRISMVPSDNRLGCIAYQITRS